jgi:hypothetical protein
MSSLQLTYRAIQPTLAAKDPSLARQIERGYAAILEFIARTNGVEQSGRMSTLVVEELAYQAKALTDQLGPQLKQAVALLGVNLPRKPTLI